MILYIIGISSVTNGQKKSWRQPEMSGWIQATMQQNTNVELKLKTRVFAKMAINTSLRSAALCAP